LRGHPENFELPGVECTTGPLGQGLAMAVGFAMAERHLNALRQRSGRSQDLRDRGRRLPDGRHQPRGVGLAGHLKLGRLIVLWDNNNITIDGDTSVSTSEDILARYIQPAGMWWIATATISPTSSARLPKRWPIRVLR
jgi:transketolase